MGQSTLSAARAKARRRNRTNLKRSPVSDITAEQELQMRRRARNCPLCGVRMTDVPGLPDSKHLDHIVPIAVGGTHTHGNARILCRSCNLCRPKDGSDYSGPVTLWAQGEIPVGRPDRRPEVMRQRMANTATCRNGLHPWTAENIAVWGGKPRCRACDTGPLRPCAGCGTPSALPGRQAMCAGCVDDAARRAAELHAGGLSWKQVAPLVGYGSGTGARYAAKRAGYLAAKS